MLWFSFVPYFGAAAIRTFLNTEPKKETTGSISITEHIYRPKTVAKLIIAH
jgi:hypothetical protein